MAARRKLLILIAWMALAPVAGAQTPEGAAPPSGGKMAPGALTSLPGATPYPASMELGAFAPPVAPPPGSALANGFTDRCPPEITPCLSFGLDYVFLWFKADSLPPVLTTGNPLVAIPGGLGQPGTTILNVGEQRVGLSQGGRVCFTWLAAPEWTLEGNFLLMAERTKNYTSQSDGNGSPVLSRPYFDLNGGFENADPRALPNVLRGSTSDALRTQVLGSELYARHNVSGADNYGFGLSLVTGARWFNLSERYRNADLVQDLPLGNVLALAISDTFQTSNNFIGGQLGAQVQYRGDACTFGIEGKCAFGANYQSLRIDGGTIQRDLALGTLTRDLQGLYAQVSNRGSYSRARFSLLPELALHFGLDLNDCLRLKIGYGVILFTDVIRPGAQIDRVLGQPVLNPAVVPLRPQPSLNEENFWAQWVNIGFELKF